MSRVVSFYANSRVSPYCRSGKSGIKIPKNLMWYFIFYVIYVNNMSQAAESNLYLYDDNSCLLL